MVHIMAWYHFDCKSWLETRALKFEGNTWSDYIVKWVLNDRIHYSDVIMGSMTSQVTSLNIVYTTVHSGRSKKTSNLRVTGRCVGNSPVTGEFLAQMASNAENVSIWWRHHGLMFSVTHYLPRMFWFNEVLFKVHRLTAFISQSLLPYDIQHVGILS